MRQHVANANKRTVHLLTGKTHVTISRENHVIERVQILCMLMSTQMQPILRYKKLTNNNVSKGFAL